MVGNSNAVSALIQGGCAVDLQNRAGNTALHLACQNAHAQTARLLLLGGSTPDTKNNMGDTCLHVAARYNNLNLVKILLSSLCSVTERNQVQCRGDTALHVAAALNHKRTVQVLLEAGADGTIRNNAGKTALDKARDNNNKDVALLLARAPQVHRFMRGRTIRKQRERLTAERRTQSVTRVDILPNKQDSSSVVEETTSSEQMESKTPFKIGPHQQQHCHKIPAFISSPYHHHKRRGILEQDLNKDDLRKGKNDFYVKKDLLCDDGEDTRNGKAFQLYTLYRDKNGNIRQAPANGCHCKPLLKKLEGQLKVTQEDMRLHILDIQEQVNRRLGQIECRNRHQINVLDILNHERAAAEKKNMIYRTEQRVAQLREEALMTQNRFDHTAALSFNKQAAVSHELKKSQLKDADVHIPAKAQCYKLLPSPSVEQSLADSDLESLPLLSMVSGDSSTSLANYVNLLPSASTHSVEDDYENTALFPLPAEPTSDLLLGTVDPYWQSLEVQEDPVAAVVQLCREGFSSSSSQPSISDQGPRLIQQQEHSIDGQYRKRFGELMGAHRRAEIHTESTRTLEFFIDRPTEPTFSQEKNNLHAKEVTQRFFETVSTQLERWYERKIVEVEQQTELRAQQDRKELLQRISMLEEELQKLKTNENAES
ncbi:Ankyrin repeat domain-containing protein 6 [Collichthys lucidus]|uniref:Ankyrin repeat domain-containing protein 6 n=1 Tax=Collichthys lucidus TaxID=240159 RepID=A0A4U5VE11_COLLU|nr:Ankyrin repeat domain-containing protein 6 [Collichthys lucidus]